MMDTSDTSDAPATGRQLKLPLIGGALAALLLIIIGIIVVVNLVRDSPADATERYLEAARDRDAAAVREAVCSSDGPGARTLLGIVEDSDQLVEWRMISETGSGERAEVSVDLTFANEGRTGTSVGAFTLVREDGDWKVCDIRRAGATGN